MNARYVSDWEIRRIAESGGRIGAIFMKDASQLPRLTQRLLAAGYRPEEMQNIWGGNARRVLMEGWKR